MVNPVQRDLLVEIAFGADLGADPATWSWTDVSGDLLSQSISIKRGRDDETSETQPMATSLTLDNISGDYTPDNPVGAYYPNVRRGTPLRINAPGGDSYFRIGDPQTSQFTTVDAAPLDITGDIDIRVDFLISEIDTNNDLMGKYGTAGDRSWVLVIDGGGLLRLWWSTDGTALNNVASTTTVTTGVRSAYRVTLDVNNGSGGHTVTFYSAPTIDGPWTQFGDPVVGSGTTSIHNSAWALNVGSGSGFPDTRGRMWAAQVYDGIGGTLVADADFRDLAPGTAAFTDSVGRDWAAVNGAEIEDSYSRFVGYIDEWAPSWPAGDVTGEEPPHAVTDLTASSVRRRLLQGDPATPSAIRAAIPATARPTRQLVAYWPMEDGSDATTFGSAVSGAPAMTFIGGPRPGESSDYPASAPLPTFTAAGATGSVPAYTSPTDRWQVSCVVVMPEGGVTDEATLLDIRTNGTAARWLVKYDTGGTAGQLRLQVFSSALTPVELLNVTVDPDFDGRPFLLYIEGGKSGSSDVLYTVGTAVVTDFSTVPNVSAPSGTITSQTANKVTSVGVGTALDLNNDIAIGHVAVFDAIQVFALVPGVYRALIANAGESAVDRFIRLCEGAGIAYNVYGGAGAESELMGAQQTLSLMEALAEVAETDDGILLDRMDVPGLLYRPRASLYRQEPALVLDAAVNEIANPFSPVLDDQRIRNDVTVTRAGGASARAVDEASVDAEGRYDDTFDLSLFTDDQAAGQAWWRLHLGTVPGMRYGTLTVDFDTASTDLLQQWLSEGVDVGDLLRIQNLPRQHPPGDLDLLIQGYTEAISPSRWQVTFNCSPGDPYRIGIYDGTDTQESRYDTAGSSIDEDLTTTETDVTVVTTTGPVWTQDPGHMPFAVEMGGEEMTVTAVTGTSSPQTFTVIRSVNGVVKTHLSGTSVQLADPVYYGL